MQSEILIRKIENLQHEVVAEVENFIDFPASKSRQQSKQNRDETIAAYVAKHAESDADLDEELEFGNAFKN